MNTWTRATALGCFFSFQISIATAQTLTVLHSFQGGQSDGEDAGGGLTLSPGARSDLLGTTYYGGQDGGGTVYSINLKKPYTETVEASFASGSYPFDGPTFVPNVGFFGTTAFGGQYALGTIFTLSDPENPLHTFQGGSGDGAVPYDSMVLLNGVLYGTTVDGGGDTGCGASSGCGTIFSYNPVTSQFVIFPFCQQTNCTDGAQPEAGLLIYKGLLYGTTTVGGSSSDGTVFSFDPSTRTLTTIASFDGSDNGAQPLGTLIEYNGGLVGTTTNGGVNGDGTIFSAPPNPGKISKMYDFCSESNCADGTHPIAGLVKDKGRLYGTTNVGGGTGCNSKGCGTVFSYYPPSGTPYTVLHTFCSKQSCLDGANPAGPLIIVGGNLYGTTSQGGDMNCGSGSGCGTVFELSR